MNRSVTAAAVAAYVGAVILLLLPAVLGVVAWRARYGVPRGRRLLASLTQMLLLSASYLCLIFMVVAKDVVGPDYSSRRFELIYLNMAAASTCVLWLMLHDMSGRRALMSFAISVVLAWGYIAIVSSAI